MAQPITGQVPLAATSVRLTGQLASCSVFTIKAPLTNVATAFYGPSGVTSTTGMPLDPGESFTYQRSSQNAEARYELGPWDFYVCGAPSDYVGWFVSP
jgi:hypothetical protein